MAEAGTALVVGPGPVTLSQGPAMQYLAARGCRHLERRGLRVLILEDNPATLMDVGGGARDVFVEPPAAEVVRRIVESSGVDSIWFGLGGRRGWLLALRLAREEWFEAGGVRTPDMDDRSLWLCGDRSLLRETLEAGGIANPAFQAVSSLREGQEASDRLGFPLVVRPHFSCGGRGAGLAYNLEDYPALLEEAIRESITGEVLVEEALEGWRKYVAVVLRGGDGRTCVPGMFEQQEAMPRHDEDAVLVYPPRRCGAEGEYALREMAHKVVDALDLLGVIEVKLAVSPGWESVYAVDVNPGPWRTTPLLEVATGMDILGAHLDLVAGGNLARECEVMEGSTPPVTVVAVPNSAFLEEGAGEGYISLACRSMGRTLFRGAGAAAAARGAADVLSRRGMAAAGGEVRGILEDLMRSSGGAERSGGGMEAAHCISRCADADLSHAVLVVAAESSGPSGGHEANVNCLRALRACAREGIEAAVYTPDPGFALLASQEADAVFLGPLLADEIARAASETGIRRVTAHFGGAAAMDLAPGLAAAGLEVWDGEALQEGGRLKTALERISLAGLQAVDFVVTTGLEEGEELLSGGVFPLIAKVEEPGMAAVQRLIYNAEDGRMFLADHGHGQVLWRRLHEEAQEVLVEAVALEGGHVVLLWEQLEAVGVNSADGLAVYPPRYLTSEQAQKARELAEGAIDALGWRGNLSMRIHWHDGYASIWNVSTGASVNLPFLQRASSLPLAEMGMISLCGGSHDVPRAVDACSAVRAPLIPFGLIADDDILPSPQRRSTGAVMGMAGDPGVALAKALWSQGLRPQPGGKVFLSVANREKRRVPMLARELQGAGYVLLATRGTAHALAAAGMEVETVNKLREGRPNVLDLIRNGEIGMVVNVPRGKHPHSDGFYIRAASARHGIPCITNMEVALALAMGIRQADPPAWEICPLREYAAPGQESGGD